MAERFMHHPHKMNEVGSTPIVATNFTMFKKKKRTFFYKEHKKQWYVLIGLYMFVFTILFLMMKSIFK